MYYRIHSTATDVWALTATKALMPVALTSVALVGEDVIFHCGGSHVIARQTDLIELVSGPAFPMMLTDKPGFVIGNADPLYGEVGKPITTCGDLLQ